jgi:glutamate:GABA antiporter
MSIHSQGSSQPKSIQKHIGVVSLTLLTVVSVDSMRNLPAAAVFGAPVVFYYVIAAFMFLIPVTFVAARFARCVKQDGGVYVWVELAFGARIGLLAIWLQWIENVLWYPAVLAFIVGNFVDVIHPGLVNSHWVMFLSIVLSFTCLTLLNVYGMKLSTVFSNLASVFGLLLPMLLIIFLALFWWIRAMPMHINVYDWHNFMPHHVWHQSWVACVSIMLSFCGMEVAAVHGRDIINPRRNLPLALWSAMIIIFVTLVFGSLAIAMVLPAGQINFVSGMVQAFSAFLARFHLSGYLPLLVMLFTLGGLGSVSNWLIAPTRGLALALLHQKKHPYWYRLNQHQVPERLLWLQWGVVMCLSLLFLGFPLIKQAYWILTALASQLYMAMYLIMFISYLKLRPLWQQQSKCYDWLGIVLVACGVFSTVATFLLGFIAPEQINIHHAVYYAVGMLVGFMLMIVPPFLFK